MSFPWGGNRIKLLGKKIKWGIRVERKRKGEGKRKEGKGRGGGEGGREKG